jgi:hypothetical protein
MGRRTSHVQASPARNGESIWDDGGSRGVIDPGADVLWKDVVEAMDRCRREGFEWLEFAPVLRRKAVGNESKARPAGD